MDANAAAAVGYLASAIAYSVASILFFVRWSDVPYSRPLGFASAASAAWGIGIAAVSLNYLDLVPALTLAEFLRAALWIAALFGIVATFDKHGLIVKRARRLAVPFAGAALLGLVFYGWYREFPLPLLTAIGVVAAILVLGLVEQVYRNLPTDSISGIRYLCIVLFVVSIFDLGLFLFTATELDMQSDGWGARGYIHALVAAPLMFMGRRTSIVAAGEYPRQVRFFSFCLPAASVATIGWFAADFYIETFEGNWSSVATVVAVAIAASVLWILLVSATTRSRMRVFLTKAFFRYKYDYRKEWLRFIGTLSESGLENVPTNSVRAVAQIVNSPGGVVWTRSEEEDKYVPAGAWRFELPVGHDVRADASLIRFLNKNQWVIDLQEMQFYPSRYDSLELDPWFAEHSDLWLLVPMLVGRRLYGFIGLMRPTIVPALNFEDHDLLRTVGRHAGSHIKQAESDKRIAESGQFGTYHRLSAFLMHDLSNLIAQQTLVVKNAEKHRHDPRFVDDTIDTIANSVSRMRRLMEQLSSVTKTPQSSRVSLRDVLRAAVNNSSNRTPVPDLIFEGEDLFVIADPDRLMVVIEHLIRNAQEATDDGGNISIAASKVDGMSSITISDTGCGMSPDFISQRLFRPFDSTKGSQSMGIGAYQAKNYAGMLAGKLDVESKVGAGTTFTLRLPLAD